jgi:putative ABC transport system permease protein
VFAISVKTDIHFYGLLKTIGTTGKQLWRIIRGQALLLSAFGIPVGLLFGYFFGVWLTPVILNTSSLDFGAGINSTSPFIFVFAAVFSLLTVFIGCRKPGKIAAGVSPVEAVKYSGIADGGKRKKKKTRKVTPLFMAWANVTREKRKLCVIVLSLSLALILLNGAYSASRSFDMDAYISNHAISDFVVSHSTIFNLAFVEGKETGGVRQDFSNELTSLGITETGFVYYHENREHQLTPRAAQNFKVQFEAEYDLIRRYYRFSLPIYEQRIAEGILETQIYGLAKLPFERVFSDYDRLASGNYALSVAHSDTIPIYDVGDMGNISRKRKRYRAALDPDALLSVILSQK